MGKRYFSHKLNKSVCGNGSHPMVFDEAGIYSIDFLGNYKSQCSNTLTPKSISTKFIVYDMSDPIERKISPYVGEYLGSVNVNPADTFRVRIDFFSKEDKPSWAYWTSHSNKPFYWISNFPKGFRNSTSEGLNYSELSTGFQPYITYKNLCLTDGYVITKDNTAHNLKGYSSLLNRDSLIIDYLILDTALYNQSRQVKYLKQKFSGIRK